MHYKIHNGERISENFSCKHLNRIFIISKKINIQSIKIYYICFKAEIKNEDGHKIYRHDVYQKDA